MFANVSLFSNAIVEKNFDLQRGVILYSISGAGKLTGDVNLSIKGEGKLCFKNWGVVTRIEENIEEIISGSINNINRVHRCTKLEDNHRLDVDFANKKILERKMPKGNLQSHITKDLVKNGQDKIAGYTCDIWEGYGVKKCIYKGVPLLVENYLLGVYYQKKATYINFNTNATSPDSDCSIPNYPIEKFSFLKMGVKMQGSKLPREFSKILKVVSVQMNKKLKESKISEDNMTPKEKRVWLNKIGQNIFEKQNDFLPKFLLTMKKTRVCLQRAENWIEANECVENVIELKAELTKKRENNIVQWRGKEKNMVLDQYDDNIFLLQSQMRCIRASQNITDLSTCMKKQNR